MRIGALLLLFACCLIPPAFSEPLTIAGRIVSNGTYSDYALESARNGEKIAALDDPRRVVAADEWVILQAETTDTTVQGLPLLEVVDVLHDHWKQPANWGHHTKGFGAWSGFGKTLDGEDYAGVPFEDRRAYNHDNGIIRVPALRGGTWTPGHPSVLVRGLLTAEGVRLTWNTQFGVNYALLASDQVGAGYSVISNVTATTSSASVVMPTSGKQRFFKIQY